MSGPCRCRVVRPRTARHLGVFNRQPDAGGHAYWLTEPTPDCPCVTWPGTSSTHPSSSTPTAPSTTQRSLTCCISTSRIAPATPVHRDRWVVPLVRPARHLPRILDHDQANSTISADQQSHPARDLRDESCHGPRLGMPRNPVVGLTQWRLDLDASLLNPQKGDRPQPALGRCRCRSRGR